MYYIKMVIKVSIFTMRDSQKKSNSLNIYSEPSSYSNTVGPAIVYIHNMKSYEFN